MFVLLKFRYALLYSMIPSLLLYQKSIGISIQIPVYTRSNEMFPLSLNFLEIMATFSTLKGLHCKKIDGKKINRGK